MKIAIYTGATSVTSKNIFTTISRYPTGGKKICTFLIYIESICDILQYYVKCEKFKVNDIIFPSGCEAHAINLRNKNMKIAIYTGATSVRSKNIFTTISRYPTGEHEIKYAHP